MDDYIPREAAEDVIIGRVEWFDWEIAASIRAIPAADVAPVRHGRWIADKEDVEWGNSLIRYRCSECKERPHFDKDKYKFILSPYCPWCGARMDDDSERRAYDY